MKFYEIFNIQEFFLSLWGTKSHQILMKIEKILMKIEKILRFFNILAQIKVVEVGLKTFSNFF